MAKQAVVWICRFRIPFDVNSDSTEYYWVSCHTARGIFISLIAMRTLTPYMSKKVANGYEEPVNLGSVINSVFDEHDPPDSAR